MGKITSVKNREGRQMTALEKFTLATGEIMSAPDAVKRCEQLADSGTINRRFWLALALTIQHEMEVANE